MDETLLAAAEELLAIPSTADRPDQLHRALDQVLDFVGPGFTVERFESAGRPSALVHTGTGRPAFRLILNAHLDVVPAEPHQFVPRRAGDRLYARGAQDMKLTALAMAAVFRDHAPHLGVPIALQLVTDEETGGRHGTLHQIEQGVTGAFVVVGEHSDLDIVADSKGIMHARLHATGRSAHGAYPWLGDNALTKLTRALAAIAERYPDPVEEVWRTTVGVARIDTPNRAFNQVPAAAEAWLDIRFPADDTDFSGRTPAEIEQYLGALCPAGVTVAIDHVDGAMHADRDAPDVQRLQRAARAQGYRGDFLRKHGACDGRFYARRGVPAVVFGVGGNGQHGPEEYADLRSVGPFHAALAAFVGELSSPR